MAFKADVKKKKTACCFNLPKSEKKKKTTEEACVSYSSKNCEKNKQSNKQKENRCTLATITQPGFPEQEITLWLFSSFFFFL